MQRKGVPAIDGCLCEIKEKLKALYDRTHACILRINGKTPDGNGDITLDLSDAIPGRYVESVNGQDGNVIIDKTSVGLSNVDNVSSSQILNQADANNQSRLEAFEATKLDPVELEVVNNSARIIQLEGQQVVLDDKMEQTIQYVDAIGDDVAEIKDAYVDKTTTQYITGKKYGPTPTSADYSGMWVNKDFVETTDPARRQNNLVHNIGTETIIGWKIAHAPQVYYGRINQNYCVAVADLGASNVHRYINVIISNRYTLGIVHLDIDPSSNTCHLSAGDLPLGGNVRLGLYPVDSNFHLVIKIGQSNVNVSVTELMHQAGTSQVRNEMIHIDPYRILDENNIIWLNVI